MIGHPGRPGQRLQPGCPKTRPVGDFPGKTGPLRRRTLALRRPSLPKPPGHTRPALFSWSASAFGVAARWQQGGRRTLEDPWAYPRPGDNPQDPDSSPDSCSQDSRRARPAGVSRRSRTATVTRHPNSCSTCFPAARSCTPSGTPAPRSRARCGPGIRRH